MGKVLIITGADFSKNKIENINVIGGKMIEIPIYKKSTFIAVQSGEAVETTINDWTTSEFIAVEDYFTNINGYSNFYNGGGVISGMVCFYDAQQKFISCNNEIKKIDAASGGVTKGWFNFKKPSGTKYIKMCWQSTLSLPNAISQPTVYFR